MKHDVPLELRAGYVHSLALSIATITSLQDFEHNAKPSEMEELINTLETTYDDVKRIANIRR